MSLKALSWAWEQEGLSSSEKFVLLCLANCHNDDTGRCDPSAAYIVKRTALNRKTVYGALGFLEKKGLIKGDDREGRSKHYDLNLTQNWVNPLLDTAKETPNPTQNWDNPKTGIPKNGHTQNRTRGVTQNRVGGLPEIGLGGDPKLGNETVSKHTLNSNSETTVQGTSNLSQRIIPTDAPEFSGIVERQTERFAMSSDWEISEGTRTMLESNGYLLDDATLEKIRGEFVVFWMDMKHVKKTAHSWALQFLDQIKWLEENKPQMLGKPNTPSTSYAKAMSQAGGDNTERGPLQEDWQPPSYCWSWLDRCNVRLNDTQRQSAIDRFVSRWVERNGNFSAQEWEQKFLAEVEKLAQEDPAELYGEYA